MLEQTTLAMAGGILPALVWLLFWIREDRKHPEPARLLAFTFFAGMFAVIPILKLEGIVYNAVSNDSVRLIWWAAIEELGKFVAAYLIVLWRKEVDEPIDLVIYMVTAALGFAAIENTLFLRNPILDGLMTQSILTGNLRFIGATLLHIVASTAVGISMALAFYKDRSSKRQHLVFGLILATALHAAFNLTIMVQGDGNSLPASSLVWIGIICVLLLFEKVKKIHPTNYS